MSTTNTDARSTDLRRSAPTEKRDTPAVAGRNFGIDVPLLLLWYWRWAQDGAARSKLSHTIWRFPVFSDLHVIVSIALLPRRHIDVG
jgi:hypothetical protein